MFSPQMVTTIDLLRHGECEGGNMYRGSTDVALSEQGWQQLRAAAGDFAGWQHIITSPLQRCARFAAELADRHQRPLHIESGLRELHFGDWEGRDIGEVWREQGNHVRRFFSDPVNAAPPNGEPMSAFRERVLQSWQGVVERHRGEHVLLVAHGGTIRILLAEILAMPLDRIANLEVPYASASRIRIYHGVPETPAGESYPDFQAVIFHNGRFA